MENVEIKIEVDIPGKGSYTTHAVWPVEDRPEGRTHLEMVATVIHQFAEKIDKLDRQ